MTVPVAITRNNIADIANPAVARHVAKLAGYRERRVRLSQRPDGAEWRGLLDRARVTAEKALFAGVRRANPATREDGNWKDHACRVEKLYLTTELDYEAPLLVAAPEGASEPLPTVLCLYGTGETKEGLLDAYGFELARRSYRVAVPDIRTFGEREDDYVFRAEVEILEGRSLWGLMIWDALRVVDYLAGRPDVDPRRLGVVGHSLGGHTAQAVASLDPRVAAAVASCGIFSYERFFHPRGHSTLRHPYVCVPGILAEGDIYDLYALQAPRPLLITWASRDPLVPIEAVDDFLEFAAPLWAKLGVPDGVEVFREDVEHEFTPTMRRRAFEWFDRWLWPAG